MPNAPEIFVHVGKDREITERFRFRPVGDGYGWQRAVKKRTGMGWQQCDRLVSGLLDAIVAARAKVQQERSA